jgi:glutamate racemase
MINELPGGGEPLRLVITDSGLGGLSICAELEKGLRIEAAGRSFSLIYVNAWPDALTGYNDLPDPAARARVLDRALSRMTEYRPGLIIIACNTLSVLYDLTEFARSPAVPVVGIIEAGVDLFHEALSRDPAGALVLFGTRTTVESGEHLGRLARRGIAAGRMSAVSCHGLAAAIDNDPDGPSVAGLVETCVSGIPPAAGRWGGSGILYAGLACTHYGYVQDVFRTALAARTRKRIAILDPNARLVSDLMSGIDGGVPRRGAAAGGSAGEITVEVVSKIELGEAKRKAVARRLELASPRTARALNAYTWTPDLF